jgi:dinuclear metal center YbgI/SA1388 family protein
MTTVKDIAKAIEAIAPLSYQEAYDNAGLLIGNPQQTITSVLLTLDVTEAVVQEAIEGQCQLIVAHHPLIFKGLKSLTYQNWVERTVALLIKHDIALYVAHTNLDNVLQKGVNAKFAEKIGMNKLQILQAKTDVLSKLVVYVPASHAEAVKSALFASGAGQIGQYSHCSFTTYGSGSFKAEETANPYTGSVGELTQVEEFKIEAIIPSYLCKKAVQAVSEVHPYETMAYDCIPLQEEHPGVGAGAIGELPEALGVSEFLTLLKSKLLIKLIKHNGHNGQIKKVAICGGSGAFLLKKAMQMGADAYVTADLKYHDYFDAEGVLFCDIGHYESEISSLELFYEEITDKFANIAVRFCKTNTNPIQYYF